ncbi:MAG: glycosyltransferase family 39 protein [Dehalococcoidia bacterium]
MAERPASPPRPVASLPPSVPEPGFPLGKTARVVSIEALLYALAILVAVALRLGLSAGDALADYETTTALAALDLVAGRATGGPAPLVELLTALVFFVAGGSDLAARFPLAVAGTALVAIMPFFRPLLGRLAALVAAFLLAVGPFPLGVSRRVDADSLALLLAFIVLLGLFRFDRERRVGWLVAAILAGGLLLAAGPRSVTFLLAGVGAVAVARVAGARTPLASLEEAWRTHGGRLTSPIGWAIAAALVLFVVVSTRLFLLPAGLALPALSAWVDELNGGGALGLPIVGLAVYDPLVLVFGLAGVVWLLRAAPGEPRDRSFVAFLAVWSGVGAGLAVLGGQRTIGPLSGIALPLGLIAATLVADLIRRLRRDDLWRTAAIVGAVPLMTYAYLQSASLTRTDGGTSVQWMAVFLTLGLVVAYAGLVGYFAGRGAIPVIALFAALILAAGSMHASVRLNARPTAAEWVLASVPGPAATIFPERIGEIRAARGGTITYGLSQALRIPFGWYLRDQPGQLPAEQLVDGMVAAVVLPGASPPTSGTATSTPGVYAAGSYGPPQTPRAWWRWYVWRDVSETSFVREAVLFSR